MTHVGDADAQLSVTLPAVALAGDESVTDLHPLQGGSHRWQLGWEWDLLRQMQCVVG